MRCAGGRGVGDDGHARDAGLLGVADGERDDVDVQPAEERGDAREDAGFVFDEGYECVQHTVTNLSSCVYASSRGFDQRVSGRRIISCSAEPAAIIG